MRKPITLAPLQYLTEAERGALKESTQTMYGVNDVDISTPVRRMRSQKASIMYKRIVEDLNSMYKEEAENESKN